jgi:hypothetical protein
MLTRCVRMRVVEGEALHHRSLDRPGPGAGGGDEHDEQEHDEQCDAGASGPEIPGAGRKGFAQEHGHAFTASVV